MSRINEHHLRPAYSKQDRAETETRGWRADTAFAVAVIVAAAAGLKYAWPASGLLAGSYGWGTALMFLLFGLFTIRPDTLIPSPSDSVVAEAAKPIRPREAADSRQFVRAAP